MSLFEEFVQQRDDARWAAPDTTPAPALERLHAVVWRTSGERAQLLSAPSQRSQPPPQQPSWEDRALVQRLAAASALQPVRRAPPKASVATAAAASRRGDERRAAGAPAPREAGAVPPAQPRRGLAWVPPAQPRAADGADSVVLPMAIAG